VARTALSQMRLSFEIVEIDLDTLDELAKMVEAMPRWPGSLEDATLAFTCQQRNAAVWTFNYRDLRAFPNLHFWTPG
jgi:hypothetical protein